LATTGTPQHRLHAQVAEEETMERWKGVIEPMLDQRDFTVSVTGFGNCGFETRCGEGADADDDRQGGAPCYYEKHVIRIGRWRGVILRTHDYATQTTTMRLIAHGNGSQALRAASRRWRRETRMSDDPQP